jgi:hypothetical protein
MRRILAESTRQGYAILQVDTHQLERHVRGAPAIAVALELQGQPTIEPLAIALSDLDGVFEVSTIDQARQGGE